MELMPEPCVEFDQLVDQLTLPAVAAPMFIVSNPELVVAQCMAGVIGSFPALNAREPNNLDGWLTEIKGRTDKARTGVTSSHQRT